MKCSEQELIIAELRAAVASMQSSVERNAVDSERMSRPASYLVKRLRDVEEELEREQSRRRELEEELVKASKSHKLVECERDDMRERLETVLRQREELETIRQALEQLREDNLAKEEEESLNEEENDVDAPLLELPSHDPINKLQEIQNLGLTTEMIRRMTTPQTSTSEKRWLRRIIIED